MNWTSRISGWIILAILFYAFLIGGAARPLPLFLIRMAILAGILLQMPLEFPSFLIRPLFFYLAFLLIAGLQGSVYPHATHAALAQLLFYLFFFLLCVQSLASQPSAERLIFFLAILVFGVTIWGIAERFLGRSLLGRVYLSQDSFGPFINPNHYSAFAALTLPLFWDRMERSAGQPGKNLVGFLDSGLFFLIFLTALAVAGCVLSGARVGAAVVLASWAVYVLTSRQKKFFKLLFAAGLVLSLALVALRASELETLFRTFSFGSLSAAAAERGQVAFESLRIFFRFPLFGSGLGTYFSISPSVVSVRGDEVIWDHAHNDYVELLAETGLVGFILFFGGLFALLRKSIRFPVFFSIINIAVLELADFPLKIPSLALLFLLQLAFLSCAQNKKSFNPRTSWALTAIVLIAAIFLGVWAIQDYRAFRLTQSRVAPLQAKEEAVEIQPLNAEYWEALAEENLTNPAALLHESSKKEALEALRQAAHLSPTNAHYWFALGKLEEEQGLETQSRESLKKAMLWAPYKSLYRRYYAKKFEA